MPMKGNETRIEQHACTDSRGKHTRTNQIGKFDGKTFRKESGPLGTTHGAFYAAQTFSDVPDGHRIQIGWVRMAKETKLTASKGTVVSSLKIFRLKSIWNQK